MLKGFNKMQLLKIALQVPVKDLWADLQTVYRPVLHHTVN